MAQHFFSCWNVPEISRVSKRMLGLNLSEEEEEGEGRGWRHFEDVSIVQSPVSGFGTIISALKNLRAQSKADISVPFSSQSHDVWVYIIFTSVLYLFLLGVLKQPNWPHFKKEKGDTHVSRGFSTGGSCTRWQTFLTSTLPFSLKKHSFFPAWLKPRWKMFCCTGTNVCGQLLDTNNCMVRLLGRGGAQVSLRGMSGSPWQRRTHSLCLPDPLRLLPGPFWPLSHFSAQMWKLLHTASRDLDLPS